MAVEIERKFLVRSFHAPSEGTLYRQGYLLNEVERNVRVRIAGERAFLTIKGKAQGIARPEFEYEIPRLDADALLAMCQGPLIEKRRHLVEHHGHTWEVDEFLGENAPLVVAELELKSADESFDKPDWLGNEVSDDPRYLNASLVKKPYSRW